MKRLMLVLFVLLPTFAVAQTAEECFEKGKKSYESKDYAEAYKWFKQAADQGNAKGQNGLGLLYKYGNGVEKDAKEAVKWFKLSAEQNYASAQNNLGTMYENGNGVTKDYKEAAKWYRLAADQGHANGQNNLGYMYVKGYGVKQNYSEAAEWYRKAAEQGYAVAQNNLGDLYRDGSGVEKDYNEALKWYRKAAEQSYAKGQANLGYMYDIGYGVDKDYAEALKWYQKAAGQNNNWSQNRIGEMYLYGIGVPKDYVEAAKWFTKSAEQGYAVSQTNLGFLYEEGYGVNQNYIEALEWYKKAAEQGNARAQDLLGDLYLNGKGVPQNNTEAYKWYSKAAEQGDKGAKTSLGWMYENGHGVAKDLTMAVKLYREAADMGSASAQRNMGIVYEKGIGVTQDYNEAEKWYKKALKTNPNYQKVKDDLARLEKKKSGNSNLNDSEEEKLFNRGVDYFLGRNGVAQDYAQALIYFRKAAEMGLAAAQFNVGFFYENGHGVSQNCQEAVKWYKMAAEKGYEESYVNLGNIYYFGREGVNINKSEALKWYLKFVNNPKSRIESMAYTSAQNNLGAIYDEQGNYAEALKWFRKAAEQGLPHAQYNLGLMYDQGKGIVKDPSEAIKWFTKAAIQGHDGAQYNLGCAYRDGEGIKQNFVESNKWYLKAAEQGYAEAQTSIGFSYLEGRGGFARDSQKALEWFQKAAAQGDVNGMNNIGTIYMYGDGVKRDLDKAEEWYKKALKVDPNSDVAKKNLEILERKRNAGTMTVSVKYNPDAKPVLEFVDSSISFIDPTGENAIKAGGKYNIRLQIRNIGDAVAEKCYVEVNLSGNADVVTIDTPTLETIKPGETKTVEIPFIAKELVSNGEVEFAIQAKASKGLWTGKQYIIVPTRGIDEPMVRITDYSLTAASGRVLKKKEPFDLQLILQNTDLGQANDVSVEIELPSKVLMLDGEQIENFTKLEGGEAKSLVYSLIVRNDYTDPIIPITVHVKERTGRYAKDRTISLTLDQSFASAKLSTKNYKDGRGFDMATSTSDVDKDIPTTSRTQDKTFALIIANENYEEVDPVPFASNDGAIFKTYCQQTLGIPEDNIHIISDATLGKMRRQTEWLQETMEAYRGDARVILYYAGHGIPDEKNKTAYLLPVDGFGRDVKTAYPLDELYASLAKLPSKSVTVFLDACFSGAKREGSMLTSARGIAIKVKQSAPEGNLVVFSASQGDETAYPYDDQQHGLFTYYLLKKLKESTNSLTLGELADYVTQQVMQQSMKQNGKMQTPTVLSSTTLNNSWKEIKLK